MVIKGEKMNRDEFKALERQKKNAYENGNYNLCALLGVKQGIGYAESQVQRITGDKAVEKTRKIEEILSSMYRQIEKIIDPPSMSREKKPAAQRKSYDLER